MLEKEIKGGSIKVSGAPKGAKVYIDGAYAGKLPLQIDSLTAGQHSVGVKAKGYGEYEEKVMVTEGKSIEVRAELEEVVTVTTTIRTEEPAAASNRWPVQGPGQRYSKGHSYRSHVAAGRKVRKK